MIERRTRIYPNAQPTKSCNNMRVTLMPYHTESSNFANKGLPRQSIRFCREMLDRHGSDPDYFNKIIWSDESSCKRDGYFNIHNLHSWQTVNPHEMREDWSQYQCKINLWTGIFNCHILGPVELPPTIDSVNII